MNLFGRIFSSRGLKLITVLVAAGLVAGCGNLLQPKHKVTVDAICAAGIAKPAGQSFRLVAKRSILSQGPVNVGVISACVSAALAHAGMFEAPAIAPPDVMIEVSYGQENGPRSDPGSRETYLELSARTNKSKGMQGSVEPEVWNVRVSIQGLVGRIESAMPLLSAVAASYTAMDTRFQTLIEVPQNNASIAAVREAALKTLEAKSTSPASPSPAVLAPVGSVPETK
jgi:hypothetical protein